MSPVAQTPALLTTPPADHMDASHQDDHHHHAAQPHAHGGGGDGRESSGGSGGSAPTANGHSSQQPQPPQQHQPSSANKRNPAQKGGQQVSFTLVTNDIDIGESGASGGVAPAPPPPPPPPPPAPTGPAEGGVGSVLCVGDGLPPAHPRDASDAYWFAQGDNTLSSKQPRSSLAGPNDQFFGEGDEKSSGLSAKDREDRVRQLRERQQMEKHQKLEELKEHAAAAQRFREQQENERRRRLEDMKFRDAERRSMVEERKRIIQQAEQDRREAVIRKTVEREQRMESKRRNERSSIVFAFGSSTPRMLDPKDNNSASYWGSRRATSTTNVHLADTSLARRASECGDTDLSRKRATSAHGLDRKPEDLRMSSSMYEVFHWDESSSSNQNHPPTTQGTRLTKSRDSSLERKTPPSALTWVRPFTPQPPRPTSTVLPSKEAPPPPSSTSSSSSDKTPTNASRFSVWEFGDNFTALGPMNQSSGGNGNQASPSPASTPTSSTRYSHRTASVFTGAGCTVGEDLMTRSMTAAIPASAARRRTDLMPALPSLRDHTGSRTSPRHRSPGMRSGTVTPNSPSRPTSALSQGSTNSSQVSLRTRTSPRKPRPQSIAGCSLSSADKPRDAAATPPRESRTMERKLSVGSASSGSKPARAKSAGSDCSAPATPARTPIKNPTPKKTPAQVKAESAAKKAAEKSKATPKTKSTPKTTPLQSPAVEAKPLPGGKDKKISPPREEKAKAENKKPEYVDNADENKKESPVAKTNGPDSQDDVKLTNDQEQPGNENVTVVVEPVPVEPQTQAEVPVEEASVPDASSAPKMEPEEIKVAEPMDTTETVIENKPSEADTPGTPSKPNEKEKSVEPVDKSPAQKAAEKPITGYATEGEYKAALAEKRRLAREAKERELELERQRQFEEEERERREEEEYLKMMEDQRRAEEDRLKKAIEEADRNREEEAKRKEEEEKQREETERIEAQKKLETEERLRKEEEERQARKSRVAAIMARTRGKGGSNTPTKNEAKTPSEEGKNFGDGMMSSSMTDSMINSMVDAAEAEAQAQESAAEGQDSKPPADAQATSQASEPPSVPVIVDSQASLGSEAVSVNQQQESDSSSQMTEVITVDSTSSVVKGEISVEVTTTSESNVVEDIISGISSVKVEEPHVNGDSPVPMDTTPTQSVDLLGTLSDVHSVNHNGVDNTPPQTSQGTENLLGSLEPLNSSHTSATTPAASNFEQIIDLGQTKLSNEDAVNSNPSPFIAFEQNLNKKQSQENTSTVPDLLL